MTDLDTQLARLDSWSAINGSLGSIKDKSTGLYFQKRAPLTFGQLTILNRQNALVKRVVGLIVDEAFKHGWRLTGLQHRPWDEVKKSLDRMQFEKNFRRASKWARLYGAAAMIIPAQTPAPMLAYLGEECPFYSPVVLTRNEIRPKDEDQAFGSPTFRKIINYEINLSGQASGTIVHHTRIIPFEAVDEPHEVVEALNTDGWGPSIIELIFDELSHYGASRQHAVAMMFVASLLIMKMNGYRADYDSKGGPERMLRRAQNIRATLDSLGLVLVDKEDDLQSLQLGATGAHEMLDRLANALAAVQEAPREILFNESPAGLNAGELSGPQELWFSKVTAWQEEEAKPRMRKFLDVYFAATGTPEPDYEIEFDPLWTKSEEQEADNYLKRAQGDAIYVENLGADPAMILDWRFRKGETGMPEHDPSAPKPITITAEDLGAEMGVVTDEATFPTDLCTKREAAERLGISTLAVTRMTQHADGPKRYMSPGSKQERVSMSEVESAMIVVPPGSTPIRVPVLVE